MNSGHIYESGEYLSNNPDWHEGDSPWKAKQIALMINKNQLALESVAEIGCGSGRILYELAQDYPSVKSFHGYDLSSHAITIAQQYALPGRILFFQKDFSVNSLKHHYSLLLLIDVFEHIEDYIGFLRNLNRSADHYIFHIPLDMHVQAVVRDLQISRRDRYGHLHYFSKATALRTIEDTGYRVLDYYYTPGKLEVKSSKTHLGDYIMNIPRKFLFPMCPDLTVKLFGGYSLLVLAESC